MRIKFKKARVALGKPNYFQVGSLLLLLLLLLLFFVGRHVKLKRKASILTWNIRNFGRELKLGDRDGLQEERFQLHQLANMDQTPLPFSFTHLLLIHPLFGFMVRNQALTNVNVQCSLPSLLMGYQE